MKHFLIYTNQHKDQDMQITERIRIYLESRGQKVSLRVKKGDFKRINSDNQREISYISEDVDCMLVLGGDGTVLQAAREAKALHIPIIGVNLGTLGFMTQIEPEQLEPALERLINDDYEQEERMMLEGTAYLSEGQTEDGWALNDIVIARSGSLQIINFNIYVNGQLLNVYSADGVIVTTPTGSTGYNLSAGGPIIEPKAKLMMLTPICPHTLNQRSIVLSPEDIVEIEIAANREGKAQTVEASFDGTQSIALSTGDRIRIVKSKDSADFIQLNRVSFLKVLNKKMNQK